MRRRLAQFLRRVAHRLHPLPTEAKIRELREFYDTHCAITGEPLVNNHYSINVRDTEDVWAELQRRNG